MQDYSFSIDTQGFVSPKGLKVARNLDAELNAAVNHSQGGNSGDDLSSIERYSYVMPSKKVKDKTAGKSKPAPNLFDGLGPDEPQGGHLHDESYVPRGYSYVPPKSTARCDINAKVKVASGDLPRDRARSPRGYPYVPPKSTAKCEINENVEVARKSKSILKVAGKPKSAPSHKKVRFAHDSKPAEKGGPVTKPKPPANSVGNCKPQRPDMRQAQGVNMVFGSPNKAQLPRKFATERNTAKPTTGPVVHDKQTWHMAKKHGAPPKFDRDEWIASRWPNSQRDRNTTSHKSVIPRTASEAAHANFGILEALLRESHNEEAPRRASEVPETSTDDKLVDGGQSALAGQRHKDASYAGVGKPTPAKVGGSLHNRPRLHTLSRSPFEPADRTQREESELEPALFVAGAPQQRGVSGPSMFVAKALQQGASIYARVVATMRALHVAFIALVVAASLGAGYAICQGWRGCTGASIVAYERTHDAVLRSWKFLKGATFAAYESTRNGATQSWKFLKGATFAAHQCTHDGAIRSLNVLQGATIAAYQSIRNGATQFWNHLKGATIAAYQCAHGGVLRVWNLLKGVSAATGDFVSGASRKAWDTCTGVTTSTIAAAAGLARTVREGMPGAWRKFAGGLSTVAAYAMMPFRWTLGAVRGFFTAGPRPLSLREIAIITFLAWNGYVHIRSQPETNLMTLPGLELPPVPLNKHGYHDYRMWAYQIASEGKMLRAGLEKMTAEFDITLTKLDTLHDQKQTLRKQLIDVVWELDDVYVESNKTSRLYKACAKNEAANLRKIKALRASKDDALAAASACEASANILSTRASTLEGTAAALQSDVADLTASVRTLNGTVVDLEAANAILRARIDDLQALDSSIQAIADGIFEDERERCKIQDDEQAVREVRLRELEGAWFKWLRVPGTKVPRIEHASCQALLMLNGGLDCAHALAPHMRLLAAHGSAQSDLAKFVDGAYCVLAHVHNRMAKSGAFAIADTTPFVRLEEALSFIKGDYIDETPTLVGRDMYERVKKAGQQMRRLVFNPNLYEQPSFVWE